MTTWSLSCVGCGRVFTQPRRGRKRVSCSSACYWRWFQARRKATRAVEIQVFGKSREWLRRIGAGGE